MPPESSACRPLPADDLEHILTHSAPVWEQARGKSFFITGGTGFFGMWLLESFAHINSALGLAAQATVLTRDPDTFLKKAPHLQLPFFHFLKGDIRNFQVSEERFDYLIHAATEVSGRQNSSPEELRDATVAGTRHILDFAARAGIKKHLFTSSGAVYGTQASGTPHLSEDDPGTPDPALPQSAYGIAKRVSETLVLEHARQHAYDAKIARCFAFVGPHLPLDSVFAIGNFIRDALVGHPIRINGDGSPLRSYLYAADLAIWLWTLLLKPSPHAIYNVGSADDLSIADLALTVKDTLASLSEIEILGSKSSSSPLSRYVPSVERAHRDLCLLPLIPLQEAILKTARWHHPISQSPLFP